MKRNYKASYDNEIAEITLTESELEAVQGGCDGGSSSYGNNSAFYENSSPSYGSPFDTGSSATTTYSLTMLVPFDSSSCGC